MDKTKILKTNGSLMKVQSTEVYLVKYGMPDHVKTNYSKCSKISNTFLFLFSNKMLVIRTGIHKMLVRIADREEPDQTASSEAV